MDQAGLLVTGLTVALLVLLMSGRMTLDALGVGLLIVLVGTGLLTLDDALKGFGNHAVVAIAALYVVGEGLTRTGAVEFLARAVLAFGRGQEFRLVMAVGLVTAAFSAFLNNTAVVVVFIPVLIGVARETSIPVSRLLIPMSYASLFGGMCTLVGTSTNLLVDGVAVQENLEPLGMFELSPVGIPLTILGVLFMAVFGRRLLPNRESLSATLTDTTAREYATELVIGRDSPLVGRVLGETFGPDGPRVLFLVRDEELQTAPPADFVFEPGDVVMLRGDVSQLTDTQQRFDLAMTGNLKFDPRTMTFFELAVSPHSTMLGRRISDLYLWRDYDAAAVAVLRHGQHIRERIAKLVLRPGDLLLVCGDQASPAKFRASTDFFLLTGAHRLVVLRRHARRALAIAAAVVALFTIGALFREPHESATNGSLLSRCHVPLVALAGAVAMVASGCVSARRAYRTIDWPILIFVVGTLALGEAMRKTGAAELYATAFLGFLDQHGPAVVLGGLGLLAILFNAVVAHSAVAILLTPIAVEIARNLGPDVSVRPFLLAVAFGGSIAFMTPQAHQVNLMVYGPGGYRYSDFLRLGIPLSVVSWLFVTLALSWQQGWL